MDQNKIKNDIFQVIKTLLENKEILVVDEMPIIGNDSLFDSMKLVELCLILEDKAVDLGFEFDWTSDVAMSRSRSMFRTVDSLITEFFNQMELNK